MYHLFTPADVEETCRNLNIDIESKDDLLAEAVIKLGTLDLASSWEYLCQCTNPNNCQLGMDKPRTTQGR